MNIPPFMPHRLKHILPEDPGVTSPEVCVSMKRDAAVLSVPLLLKYGSTARFSTSSSDLKNQEVDHGQETTRTMGRL